MTDRFHPDNPDDPAVELAKLEPRLQLALRQVANVDDCCRSLRQIYKSMPVLEGLTTTIPAEWEGRPRLWIHDAIRACERLPANWRLDVKRAWALLADAVNLYHQTSSSMGRYIEIIATSLNARLTTSAHEWAYRYLDQYPAGDPSRAQIATLLEESEMAFAEIDADSEVSAGSSDSLGDEISVIETLQLMEVLTDTLLERMAKTGRIAPTETAPESMGKLLPLDLDQRQMSEHDDGPTLPSDDGLDDDLAQFLTQLPEYDADAQVIDLAGWPVEYQDAVRLLASVEMVWWVNESCIRLSQIGHVRALCQAQADRQGGEYAEQWTRVDIALGEHEKALEQLDTCTEQLVQSLDVPDTPAHAVARELIERYLDRDPGRGSVAAMLTVAEPLPRIPVKELIRQPAPPDPAGDALIAQLDAVVADDHEARSAAEISDGVANPVEVDADESPPLEPRPVSADPHGLRELFGPLRLDPRPAAKIVGLAPIRDPARMDTDPAVADELAEVETYKSVAALTAVADDQEGGRTTVADDQEGGRATVTDDQESARVARTIKRYQMAVGALCAAAALILVVFGSITYRAQKQADKADARAILAIEKARAAPVHVEVSWENQSEEWLVRLNEVVERNGIKVIVREAQ